jgi:hypothetical protein
MNAFELFATQQSSELPRALAETASCPSTS